MPNTAGNLRVQEGRGRLGGIEGQLPHMRLACPLLDAHELPRPNPATLQMGMHRELIEAPYLRPVVPR